MKPEIKEFLANSSIELLVYCVLVCAYFFLVLHFLGDWLNGLFLQDRRVYAAVALGLIVGQGVALELLTGLILRLVRARRRHGPEPPA
jgi:hypothetical protein